jgi:hypothetical protein
MRTAWAAAFAVFGLLGQPQGQPGSRVVVVVDGDSPVADPASAARWRDGLLAQLGASVPVAYYSLTADGLAAIPPSEAAEFRRTRFRIAAPVYSGIHVSFAESVEVLRGNEFVRDTLIERECATRADECVGLVRGAVDAEVRRTETSGTRKLRALAAAAPEWRGARVVVFTTGWPARDDGRVGVAEAVRRLREHAVAVAVVRMPAPAPYRGLVRDASESVAAQLPGRFFALGDDADVAAAADGLWHGLPRAEAAGADATAPAPAAPAVPMAAPMAAPADSRAAASDSANTGQPLSGETALADPVLRRATAYVDRFERTFTSVTWHERYEQELRLPRRFGSSGASTTAVSARRLLESELFFAWLPTDATWITVRDVVVLDGRARPDSERRLPSLAARASVSLPELRDLARQNGRFNLGPIVRTFNEPTLALLFVDARHVGGVRFTRVGRQSAAGRTVITYQFEERGRPTLIRSGERDVPVRGTLAIDEATGAVWSSRIELSAPAGGLTGRMAVDYEPHVAFDVLVPRDMRESYASSTERVDAFAVYSDFRRFQTSGRLILTP